MKLLSIAIWLLSVVLLSGCATHFSVDTDFDKSYSFQHKKRFAIKTPPQQEGVSQDLRNQRIERSLARALTDRGFHQAPKDEADLIVSYFFTTEDRQEVINYNGFYSYYGYYHCHHCFGLGISNAYIHHYREGTLIIDIVDPVSRTIKWRGSTSSRLYHNTPEKKDRLFEQIVTAILAHYPPQQPITPIK